MDLQGFWYLHKVFIRNVGIGAAVYLFIVSLSFRVADEAQGLALRNERTAQMLKDEEQRLVGLEGLEKGRAEALVSRFEPALIETLLWRLADSYQLGKEENRYLAFTEKRKKTSLAIREAAKERNVKLPESFGFLSEEQEARVAEHLIRLHMTERLLIELLNAGASNVTRVDQLEAQYEKLPIARGGMGYLRRLPLAIACELAPGAFPKVLAELQQAGLFLEVLEFRQSGVIAAKGELAKLEIHVAALTLCAEGTASQNGVNAGGGEPSDGVRPVGGLRRFGRGR